jgi:hypothetical protein
MMIAAMISLSVVMISYEIALCIGWHFKYSENVNSLDSRL